MVKKDGVMPEQGQIDVAALITIIGDKDVQLYVLRQQVALLREELSKTKKDAKVPD